MILKKNKDDMTPQMVQHKTLMLEHKKKKKRFTKLT